MDCTRHAFDGCAGDGGPTCRDCPATIYIPASETPMGRHILKQSLWRLYAVLAVACLAFVFAATSGFNRAESAYQTSERV